MSRPEISSEEVRVWWEKLVGRMLLIDGENAALSEVGMRKSANQNSLDVGKWLGRFPAPVSGSLPRRTSPTTEYRQSAIERLKQQMIKDDHKPMSQRLAEVEAVIWGTEERLLEEMRRSEEEEECIRTIPAPNDAYSYSNLPEGCAVLLLNDGAFCRPARYFPGRLNVTMDSDGLIVGVSVG